MTTSILLQSETVLDLGNKNKIKTTPAHLGKSPLGNGRHQYSSNCSSIDNNNITIKPDMNPQDQHKEALLLK